MLMIVYLYWHKLYYKI